MAAGITVHQSADIFWAALWIRLVGGPQPARRQRLTVGTWLPWALGTAAVEYWLILTWLQRIVRMDVLRNPDGHLIEVGQERPTAANGITLTAGKQTSRPPAARRPQWTRTKRSMTPDPLSSRFRFCQRATARPALSSCMQSSGAGASALLVQASSEVRARRCYRWPKANGSWQVRRYLSPGLKRWRVASNRDLMGAMRQGAASAQRCWVQSCSGGTRRPSVSRRAPGRVSLGRAAPTQSHRVYVGVTVGGMFWLSAKMLSGSYLSFNATSRPNFSSP
jgi:hypothetical protein